MNESQFADGRAGIDARLVARLVAEQFPQWSELPVTPVEQDGWDNRTYRLGDAMTVRLPTSEAYAPAVKKEHRWLPMLARRLPVQIPESLGLGAPSVGYPFHWSVRRWIDGATADRAQIDDLPAFAVTVAGFITALQHVDATGGPQAGAHCFYRGTALTHYDEQTREAIGAMERRIDKDAATSVWETALDAAWEGPPVWFHGDIASGNLLVRDGRLAAVIDFGTSGVGDPACDLVVAWTMFKDRSRQAFRRAVGQDEGTWARARGWAIWKALITLRRTDLHPEEAAANRRVIADAIAEHQQ